MFDSDKQLLLSFANFFKELAKLAKFSYEIRKKEIAYFLWEQSGRPECDGKEFWYKAEKYLGEKHDASN